MVNIQPINIWKDGSVHVAEKLTAYSISDDLSTSATFFYSLSAPDTVIPEVTQEVFIPAVTEEQLVAEYTDEQGNVVPEHYIIVILQPERTETVVVSAEEIVPGQVLASGNVIMSGQDYQNWGFAGANINDEAYQYIASVLNITIVP